MRYEPPAVVVRLPDSRLRFLAAVDLEPDGQGRAHLAGDTPVVLLRDRGQFGLGGGPPFVELEASHYQALYDLAEAAGYLVPGTSVNPVQKLLGEILDAYVLAKEPTLKKIYNRKLEAELEADEAASARYEQGRRMGRDVEALGPLPGEDEQ